LTVSLNGHLYVLISGHNKANEWAFYRSQNNLQLSQKMYQKLATSVPHYTVLQQCGQLAALLDGNTPLKVTHVW